MSKAIGESSINGQGTGGSDSFVEGEGTGTPSQMTSNVTAMGQPQISNTPVNPALVGLAPVGVVNQG